MNDVVLPDPVAALVAAADQLPSGSARLELLTEAVRVADTHRHTGAGFHVRRLLIDEAACCLRYDLYATTFSWCLAVAQCDPHRFPVVELLRHYQFVIGKVVNFPEVTR